MNYCSVSSGLLKPAPLLQYFNMLWKLDIAARFDEDEWYKHGLWELCWFV